MMAQASREIVNGVEQRLRGMLMLAIAAVDHMGAHVLGQDARSPLRACCARR